MDLMLNRNFQFPNTRHIGCQFITLHNQSIGKIQGRSVWWAFIVMKKMLRSSVRINVMASLPLSPVESDRMRLRRNRQWISTDSITTTTCDWLYMDIGWRIVLRQNFLCDELFRDLELFEPTNSPSIALGRRRIFSYPCSDLTMTNQAGGLSYSHRPSGQIPFRIFGIIFRLV